MTWTTLDTVGILGSQVYTALTELNCHTILYLGALTPDKRLDMDTDL